MAPIYRARLWMGRARATFFDTNQCINKAREALSVAKPQAQHPEANKDV